MLEVLTSIANFISSLLALITAIIAYKLAKNNKGGRLKPPPFGVTLIIPKTPLICKNCPLSSASLH